MSRAEANVSVIHQN